MKTLHFRACLLLPLLPLVLGGVPANGAEPVDFTRDIRPILSQNCVKCHGPDAEARATDLRLDNREGLYGEIDGTPVVQPGDSQAGLLMERVTAEDEADRMPPPGSNLSLTPQQIALLKRWVEEGAAWESHWSFQPIVRPSLPKVSQTDWPFNPIDRFVLERLEVEGLAPSPDAEKFRWLRRVTLDLTGLPPTPEQVAAFLADDEPGAHDRVVDRLLASPAFGERMAWDWLDAARYADSNGYQGDNERTMWPWRDWVVRAFNENLPFDQFTVWQLAGDLLPEPTFDQRLATGFSRNHMINGEGGRIAEENRVEYVMDMAETAGTVWLGLTFNCCRCHDHKYDPLTRADYYSLFGFFNQTPVTGAGGNPQTAPVLEVPSANQQKERTRLQTELRSLNESLNQRKSELAGQQAAWEVVRLRELTAASESSNLATPDETEEALRLALETATADRSEEQRLLVIEAHRESDDVYRRQKSRQTAVQKGIERIQSAVPKVMVMADQSEPRPTHLLERGLYNKPEGIVLPGVPASLPPLPSEATAKGRSPNRLDLGKWLVSDDHPLTARVTVNRIWQQFFGAGLVKTPEDFGAQGAVPEHAALLDWLAADFRDSGWDVKRLCRLIVTSRVYRQSSRVTPELAERDPENRLLARGPRFRLPAWMIRDQALAASGLRSTVQGGPSVNVYQPAGVWEEATFGKKKYQQSHGDSLYRRSLYVFWRRIVGPTMFFDSAARQVCTVKMVRTNTPLHSLLTFNDVTYVEAARALAERVLESTSDDDATRLDSAFLHLLARPATLLERDVLLSGLDRARNEFLQAPEEANRLLSIGGSPRNPALPAVEHASWTALCLAVLNLDETVTKE